MGLTIRRAAPRDAPEISRLLAQLGYAVEPDDVEHRLGRLAGDPGKAVWVAAAADGCLVGCGQAAVDLRLAEGERVEITSLVVDAAARGGGIGRRLTDAAEAWAAALGHRRLRVRCNARREAAHRFYESAGFRETKSQKVFDKPIDPAPGGAADRRPEGA